MARRAASIHPIAYRPLLALGLCSADFADLEQAQEIAEKTGVGYQTVLKQAIRGALKH